jgi:site-specific recombinase XerD
MSAIVPRRAAAGALSLPRPLLEAASQYVDAALAPNTRRAYRSAWGGFVRWCSRHALDPLPASGAAVALFLTDRARAGRRVSSIQTAMAAIRQAHEMAKHANPCDSPEVRLVARGIRRTVGVAARQKTPILVPVLRSIVSHCHGRVGLRDRALLLLGFAGAFRRSELVGLHVEDLCFDGEGLRVRLRKSKTDQEGEGRTVAIPFGESEDTCPVRAVRGWLDEGVDAGPIFRRVHRGGGIARAGLSGRAVALICKAHVGRCGLDPAHFAGHSLRSGFATQAAKAGKSERAIAAQTGHRDVRVLRRYIREANLFVDNAAKGIGL